MPGGTICYTFSFYQLITFFIESKAILHFGCSYLLLFISIYADPEAIADLLNPLTISHTANTISCTAIGRNKISTGLMLKDCNK